jgi:hypothetical protein
MWVIAVLLPISFVLFVLARIAKTQRMFMVLYFCGVAVLFAPFLVCMRRDYAEPLVIVGSMMVLSALSELIAISVWRRRVAPPSVLVKSVGRVWVFYAVMLCLWIAFVAFLLGTEDIGPLRMIVHTGLATAWMILILMIEVFGTTEIGVDGIRQNGRLRPWKKYESFSWERNSRDGVDLTLVSDSSICPTTRFLVRPEDREAVQQILKAALKDLSAIPRHA